MGIQSDFAWANALKFFNDNSWKPDDIWGLTAGERGSLTYIKLRRLPYDAEALRE
jgi:hypothetical protein